MERYSDIRRVFNREVIIRFIESIDSGLLINDELELISIKGNLLEAFAFVEPKILASKPTKIFQEFTKAKRDAENLVVQVELKFADCQKNGLNPECEKEKNNLEAYNLNLNFWNLLIKEYETALLNYERSKDSSEHISGDKIFATDKADSLLKVREILKPLSGLSTQHQPIMPVEDFNRLIEYTIVLVKSNTLPVDIKPIGQTGISNEHIRFTFYRLHRDLFGTRRINMNFIEFIHAVFTQFSGTDRGTTKQKFATSPKSYEKDFAGYIGDAP